MKESRCQVVHSSDENNAAFMRSFTSKINFPSAYAVLMLVVVLGAALTWMLPVGRYDVLRYD
jgi:uncharacterized ion transporter superfamily protein YfcC